MTDVSAVHAEAFLRLDTNRGPREVAAEIQTLLADRGRRGFEGVGFWVGRLSDRVFQVEAAVIPAQRARRSTAGVSVLIEADELFRLNVWLHHNGLTPIAQVHSHPEAAYHSDADDAYPVVTKLGALSVVVPDFASDEFSLDRIAVYRLMPGGHWDRLPVSTVQRLIQLHDDF
jgi:hypothetical protein